MIREFTEKEKQILRDGLNEDNYSTHDILMMGFNEEQILRRMDEEEEEESQIEKFKKREKAEQEALEEYARKAREEEPKDRFPTADERWPRAGKPIDE